MGNSFKNISVNICLTASYTLFISINSFMINANHLSSTLYLSIDGRYKKFAFKLNCFSCLLAFPFYFFLSYFLHFIVLTYLYASM